MIRYKIITMTIAGIVFWTLAMGLACATEPDHPKAGYAIDAKQEARIQNLKSLPIGEGFNGLKSKEFLTDKDLLHQAVSTVFGHRRKEAVNFAMGHIRLPVRERAGYKVISRYDNFNVAKNILQAFPDDSVDPLLELYRVGDPVTKGNVIRVSGKIEDRRIRNLLIKALDDKTFREEEDPEIVGEPLRICDEAYNQIVLHYHIKNVPRTIGNANSIEDRDHYINELKSLF